MRVRSKPLLYSILSGCAWAMIGYGIAYSVAPIRSTPFEVGRTFLGGVMAAPLIGLLIGVISRNFASLGRSSRVAVALGDLYLATWLFLLAVSFSRLLLEFGGLAQQRAFRVLVLDPLMGTLLGLTYTGYVLVLWPMSYVNHVLVARSWNASRVA